ncbi:MULTISPECIES: hypothetical protein [Nostocales]|nr:hypothetical protein [Tolypothrix bouteillei]KAF3888905.1 hypothetical protein DA73_0400028045 [Tolypothrix bouteillei VB521301]
MIISDLEYLEQIPEISAVSLINGGGAIAISGFSALAYGQFTNTSSRVNNRTVTGDRNSFASSSVSVTSVASGSNTFSNSSASSSAYVS